MPNLQRCPLCEAPLAEAVLTIGVPDRFERSVGITAENYWRAWRRCDGCGVAINVHRPEDSEKLQAIAKNYYEVDLGNEIGAKYQFVMNLPEGRSDNAGRAQRVLYKLLALRSMQELPPPTSIKVADVGAGTGVFLAKLGQLCTAQAIKLDAVAIEPDPLAAEHLRGLGIARVHEAVLDAHFTEGEFDLVTFNKVLEHIEFPIDVVCYGRRILNERTGLFYAEVPDIETIRHRPITDNILGALHYHLYAPHSLDQLLQRGGVVPLELQRILEPSGKLTVFGFAISPQRYKLLAST